jgi:bacillopeptidase F (M6 metalloprotease family)
MFSRTTNLHQAIRDALDYLDKNKIINFVDFDTNGDGKIDAITILHSGFAAEWISTDEYGVRYQDRIWSHKWNLFSDASGQYKGPWQSRDGVVVWEYHIRCAFETEVSTNNLS